MTGYQDSAGGWKIRFGPEPGLPLNISGIRVCWACQDANDHRNTAPKDGELEGLILEDPKARFGFGRLHNASVSSAHEAKCGGGEWASRLQLKTFGSEST